MVRLVRAEKMVLSGLVFARKITRMILIQNIWGLMGPLMIYMAFMPLFMWEMWDVMPVTHTRTVESSAVFCLSRIRNCTPCTSNKNCADAYVVRVRPFRNDKNAFYRTWDRPRTESRRSCCICSKEQEKAGSIISKSILMWYPRKISTTLFKPQSVTLPVTNIIVFAATNHWRGH